MALSPTPAGFDQFVAAVTEMMSTQPNYSANDLKKIKVPVNVVRVSMTSLSNPNMPSIWPPRFRTPR